MISQKIRLRHSENFVTKCIEVSWICIPSPVHIRFAHRICLEIIEGWFEVATIYEKIDKILSTESFYFFFRMYFKMNDSNNSWNFERNPPTNKGETRGGSYGEKVSSFTHMLSWRLDIQNDLGFDGELIGVVRCGCSDYSSFYYINN